MLGVTGGRLDFVVNTGAAMLKYQELPAVCCGPYRNQLQVLQPPCQIPNQPLPLLLCLPCSVAAAGHMLSVVASLTPYSDYNQSPRNMYQCQMGKQTMGTPAIALTHRTDTKLYRILTPQTPIARTSK